MRVIEKDMRACIVNKNMVRERDRWREGIRVSDPYEYMSMYGKKAKKGEEEER